MREKRLPESNKGYQLLRKAGWVEGTGLGVEKQGRTTPLQAWLNDGRRGIGSAPKKPTPPAPPPTSTVSKPKRKRKTKEQKKLQRIDREALQYRAIRRKLSECSIPEAALGGDASDSNPLLRSNALTFSNPLLP